MVQLGECSGAMRATAKTRLLVWTLGGLLLCSCTEGAQFNSANLCSPGELKCLGGDVYACTAAGDQFELHQTCVGGTECIDGECQFAPDAADALAGYDGQSADAPACTPDGCASLMGDAPACRRWDCEGPQCKLAPVQNGTPCTDANACTTGDACQEGQCIGAHDDCDDQIQCTLDQCDASAGCSHTLDHSACNDDNPCTQDSCSLAAGCDHAPLTGAACDDGDICSTGDHCTVGGSCMPTEMVGDIACITKATCLEGWDLCQGHPLCAKVGCDTVCLAEPDTQVVCPESDAPCAVNPCNPDNGQCELSAAPDGQECEDGDPCTMGDYCEGALCYPGGYGCGICLEDDDCEQYDDNDACNGILACDVHDFPSTKCIVDPASVIACNPSADTQCDKNTCDPSSGACHLMPLAEGTPCDGPSACYSDWTCDGDGECVGEQKKCDDDNPCTDDFCDAASGECVPVPNDENHCDDGDPLTENACVAGVCAVIEP